MLVALGARQLPLAVLSEDLALDLLASWSGQARQALPPVARKVSESCGYLPLALALAGARIQGGGRWEDVCAALERGRLEFLDHPYGSVFKSLRMSTDALPTTDCDRYFDLAVFPEDVDVPVETVGTLWRYTGCLEEFEARDLLRSFERKSLLTLSRDGEQVLFHDLQHDFLRLNVGSSANAQDALIEAYRSRCADNWASGPNDGYFFSFLPHHLAAADRRDELTALLADYTWIEAKLKATDVQSVISDYDLVANEPDLRLVQRALRLSILPLSHHWTHLPGQLIGRLRQIDEPRIGVLLEKATAGPGMAWLCPQTASLVAPGPLLQTFKGHTSCVTALAVLPDGRALSGSEDGELRLWDLESGKSCELAGHTGAVRVLALPDGRALSGSEDGTLRLSGDWSVILWDLARGASIASFVGDAPITCVAATLTRLLAGTANGAVHILRLCP